MSHRVQIFVATATPLIDFVGGLETLLGVSLNYSPMSIGMGYEGYHAWDGKAVFVALQGGHDLETDKDMNFEDYQYQISIEGATNDAEVREQSLYDFAYTVFQKLRGLKKYNLMMTDDLQKKIAEFDLCEDG